MTDLILFNGKVTTQDAALSECSAVAMKDGRITAIGFDPEVLALQTPGTKLINLHGKRVIPGLVDSHVHFYDWATGLRQLKLETVHSLADLLRALEAGALDTRMKGWIIGQGWNAVGWPEGRQPDRHDLDSVVADRPVFFMHSSLHQAVVNTAALREMGIDASTPNPPQGIIDREADGYPTGMLRDLAMNLVTENMPPLDENDSMDAFKEGFAIFHSLGLTGVTDQRLMGAPEGAKAFRLWQRMHELGEISLRVWMNLPGEKLDELIALGMRTGCGDEYLRMGHVKFFSDGAQGSRTAWMLEPYEDRNETGLPLTPMEVISDALLKAHSAGLAMAIHAIGDRANHELANAFERLRDHPLPPLTAAPAAPHRIEHAQIIQPADLQRLARLGVVVSAQPKSATDDIEMMPGSIGERARFAYPFKTMLKSGIPLVFSSDCPVCDPNPFLGIHAAVTRQRPDNTPAGGWYPDECLTVDEAVWCFSMGAAYVNGQTANLGSISVGKLADLVVLDRDIFSIPASEIQHTKPLMTVFDGKVVYER